MTPALAQAQPYGVALLGEALGETEAEEGSPFVGKAGFRLNRLIEWAGLERNRFDIYNSVWCRPPGNELNGTPYELPAIAYCKAAHWGDLLQRSRVIVPLGNVPTNALIGRKGILTTRGYIWQAEGRHIIPTVHPSFIQRGQARWSAAFINDLQKAVELAAHGMPAQFLDYHLDPLPIQALEWAREYHRALAADPTIRLAFDIETPGKGEDEDDNDTDSDAPDRTWNIDRIGFAYRDLHALSIPWEPSYRAVIQLLLGTHGDKVVWNAGFDVPRVRRAGITINGLIHDGMVAWHILHTDLPKRLGFVATFVCPWQPAWKHLSGARPAFYNATDADVEQRAMAKIDAELRRAGLWDVYQRDVLDLEPILVHMQSKGMPVDQEIRLDRATKLDNLITQTRKDLENVIPLSARRIDHVYAKTPKDLTGLLSREGIRSLPFCSVCGLQRPLKPHFKSFKKKVNPCAGGQVVDREVGVTEYYRLAVFSPSRDQLIRYHQAVKRNLPMVWDKKAMRRKISFGERQIKDLIGKYPLDKLYPLVLSYRSYDKIAGTYIGRPE